MKQRKYQRSLELLHIKKHLLLLCGFFYLFIQPLYSQTSDTKFSMPLTEVIKDLQLKYGITFRDPDSLLNDKTIAYAKWKYRPELQSTLNNILLPYDLMAYKDSQGRYKIKKYKYHLLTPEQGKEKLDYLETLSSNKEEWEARKKELRDCIIKSLEFDKLPSQPNSKPIFRNKRKMDGYTIENIAIETLPGLYVCGSVYKPAKIKGKVPVIISPNGHFEGGRYNKYIQIRCAALARMGAIIVNYDLFAYGESLLQFKPDDHHESIAMTIQALNSLRMLDYLTSLPEADTSRVGITGGSGGGSQTMLISAIDDRIKVSVPAVMMSCYHSGGCPCESGMPIHLCGFGTTNVEIGAMFAPKPMLVISDGGDWTDHVPDYEFPFVKRIYTFYNQADKVKNVHFPEEGHDYARSKRIPMYYFLAENLGLNSKAIQDKEGNIDESACKVEDEKAMYVFGDNGELLPENAIKSFGELEKRIKK